MILLDTNVLSEGLRPSPDANAQDWLNAQDPRDLYLCVPVLAELHYGIERLPPGARRLRIERTIDGMVQTFGGNILPLYEAAAREYGRLFALRERAGRVMGTMDGLIAAIASVHNATIATRDERGFNELGIDIVNPFAA
jgi:toxin FitB